MLGGFVFLLRPFLDPVQLDQRGPQTHQEAGADQHDQPAEELQAQVVAPVVADQGPGYGATYQRGGGTDGLGHSQTRTEDPGVRADDGEDARRKGDESTTESA